MKNQKNVVQASSLSVSNVVQASSLLKKYGQDARSTLIKTLAIVAISAICANLSFAEVAENPKETKPPAYAANVPDFKEVFKDPQFIINASKLNLKIDDKTIRNVSISGTMKRSKVVKIKDASDYAIGVSVWVKGNPDIFTVSWDDYKFDFAMEYAVLNNPENTLMSQAPGFKSIETTMKVTPDSPDENTLFWGHPTLSYDKGVEKKENSENIVQPEFPSDWLDGYPLGSELLKLRRDNRNAVLSGKVATKTLDDGRIMMPIRLMGKIVSEDGKPIHMASAWLRRNPCIMARTDNKGAFEILMRNAVLRSTDKEPNKLMITAPEFEAIEVDLKKYIDDKLVIKMKPLKLEFREDTILKMVKVPATFFRMGRGGTGLVTAHGSNCELTPRSDWPIKTVFLPSYYIALHGFQYYHKSLYQNKQPRIGILYTKINEWAKNNGYQFDDNWKLKSWYRSIKICNALSEKEGKTPCYYTHNLEVYRKGIVEDVICDWNANGYRLPTEAEWACVARAGTTTKYHWGSKLANQSPYRQWGKKSDLSRIKTTGEHQPNQFGLYDTHGPNSEWVWDWDGHWRPNENIHPKGPSLEESILTHQWLFRDTGYPIFPVGKRYRGCSKWALISQANWPDYKKNSKGGVYTFKNLRSWLDIGNSHGVPPTDHYSTIIRLTITADIDDNKIPLNAKYDIKSTLPKPILLENIGNEIDMVSLKGGEFRMGGGLGLAGDKNSRKIGKQASSYPARVVTMSPFLIAKFETTTTQWKEVATWATSKGYSFDNTNITSEDGNKPVVGVNWYDAIKWCNATSEKENLKPCYTINGNVFKTGTDENILCDWNANGYRLPTEAEWEFAARGGRAESYYWGMFHDKRYAWMKIRRDVVKYKVGLHSVGQLPGNQYGLYDIVGNAGEWCWDMMASYELMLDDTTNPKGIKSDQELKDKTMKVFLKKKKFNWDKILGYRIYRSGSHLEKAGYFGSCTGVDTRFAFKPSEENKDIGFRVAKNND